MLRRRHTLETNALVPLQRPTTFVDAKLAPELARPSYPVSDRGAAMLGHSISRRIGIVGAAMFTLARSRIPVRSTRTFCQIDRPSCFRSGLIACALATVALTSAYRIAEAQIRIIDESFYLEVDPEIEKIGNFLMKQKCLTSEGRNKLYGRIHAAFLILAEGDTNIRNAYRDKLISLERESKSRNPAVQRFQKLLNFDDLTYKLPDCKPLTEAERDFQLKLIHRLRTGKRPERDPAEEREEIGGSGRTWTGPYFGLETLENFGRVRHKETSDATGVTTFQSTESGDPPGIGIVGGYNFRPWNNRIVMGPFASFDYLNQTINHNFAGGQFLGTTTHWFINAGVKAGFVTAPGIHLYGLAGAAFLNHDLNVNFATAASSNVTTPGFTLGLGGEYQPSSWQLAGHPVSLFAQYQHTWWSNANFNTPTSSPAFNYAFRREDDTIKLGVNFYFGAAPTPPTAAPTYPVKAPALK